MYPNDNQQPIVPIDYLNQIAPKTQSRNILLRSKPILFGLIAIVVLVIAIFIGNILNGNNNLPEQLAARLLSTQEVATDATDKIKSSQLLSYNSSLTIYLTNTIRDITPLLAKKNIKINKLNADIVKTESNTKLLSKLEDARLNVIYDRTYAREMAYKLDTTLTLMEQIYKTTGDKNLKSFLEAAYKNLTPTQKQFEDFNAANS